MYGKRKGGEREGKESLAFHFCQLERHLLKISAYSVLRFVETLKPNIIVRER